MKSLFIFSFLISLLLFSGCDDSGKNNNSTNMCSSMQCDSNSHCDDSTGTATCVCDAGFVEENMICINSKMVNCIDNAPLNADASIVEVEVIYDATSMEWSTADDCAWECSDGYTLDGTSCIADAPLDGFGEITGECGVLDASNLDSENPSFFVNTINFYDDTYDASDFDQLTEGGQTLLSVDNAGGSSIYSEAFAFEVLARCEFASLLKTETEITYDSTGTITDILVMIDDRKIGVSVTRAMTYPRDQPYTVSAATTLLQKKLDDILLSSANVSSEDRWSKQILSIIADRSDFIPTIQEAYDSLPANTTADTILYITVSDGIDDFIYTNQI